MGERDKDKHVGSEADRLKALLGLHEVALGNMSHGLCLFDADERLVMCNEQYLRIFGLDPAIVKPGIGYREILTHAVAKGNHRDLSPDELHAKRMAMVRERAAATEQLSLDDGRVIETTTRPTADGGWVADHEDVTVRVRSEQALREQNLRFDAAIENMAHGISMFDADERLIVCNQQYLRIYGADLNVVKPGMTYRELLAHAIAIGNRPGMTVDQLYDERIEVVRRDGTARLTTRDGRMIEATTRRMPNGGWVTASVDITERQRHEEMLREQNLRFDAALGNMAQGLIMLDRDLRLMVCNRRFLEVYGLDPATVTPGISLMDLSRLSVAAGNRGDADAEKVCAYFSRKLIEGQVATLTYPRADGRTFAVRSQPMANGGWVITFEDITERERADQARREQSLRFDAAINNMSQGLCMFGADQRLIVCNDQYLKIFNLDPDVIKPGISLRAAFDYGVSRGNYPGTTTDRLVAQRLAALAAKKPTVFEQELAGGRTIASTLCPMANGGWVCTFEDITDRRAVEAERASAVAELREQNVRFDAALNHMSQGLCLFDADQRLIVRNEQYLRIFDADPNVIKPGVTLREVFEHGIARGLYPGVTADELLARRLAIIATKQPTIYRQEAAGGRTLAIAICPMPNGGWVGTFEDVTESRKIEAERAAALRDLREQHRRFDAALNNMTHGICMYDEDRRVIVFNSRFLDIFGLSPDVVKPGIALRDLMAHSAAVGNYPGRDPQQLYEEYVERLNAGVITMHRQLADGRIILVTHRPMVHGGWVATYEDITERQKAEDRIAYMARHDSLTGLPNRMLFHEKMAEGLDRVEGRRSSMAVLCLDLDNFKTVNDTLGHPIGDRLLSTVAQRLICVLGSNDTIARLGGDEFAILQSGPQPQAARTLARRIVEVLGQPIVIDSHEINSGVSVGIAVAPNDGLHADHLMKCADLALYRAKAEGRARYRFFEPDMDTRLQEKRALEIDLRRAVATGEFHLVYQPQVRSSDGELTGMEALLRWTHAERGAVPPAEFIPIAEETGLIVPLGEWVLRRACSEAAQWPGSIRVAVNLSPVQFKGRGLVATVASALATAGLSPHRLELEITEAVLLRDDEATIATLHQLRALGVRISMDDFGTGYSSLSYLRSFPFDKIKIDRSFIADLDRNRDSAAIVRAVAGLGLSLGIETTAEGVETAEQLELVRRDGCTEVQGYFFSRPRPAAEVLESFGKLPANRAVA
jgi:diguanylate cyclase (GGDEF)-like protein/PAS domain S-box-containing protein